RPPPARPTPSPPVLTVHPTALLDAACAVCCIVLLVTSVSQRLVASQQSAPVAAAASVTAPPTAGRMIQARWWRGQGQGVGETGGTSTLLAPSPLQQHLPGPVAEAVVACVLASSLSSLFYKLTGGGARPTANAAPAVEAAARLARLEALTDKQLAEFAVAVRQVDKLQVRTRITSGDLKRPIAQLQSASADQAAVLSRLATEVEALRGHLRDTQQLLGALQALTAKQFQVTVDAIKQLRASQAALQ
ncbi:hypothetical protein TSOC_001064, partial [Tetrabaena socialis]